MQPVGDTFLFMRISIISVHNNVFAIVLHNNSIRVWNSLCQSGGGLHATYSRDFIPPNFALLRQCPNCSNLQGKTWPGRGLILVRFPPVLNEFTGLFLRAWENNLNIPRQWFAKNPLSWFSFFINDRKRVPGFSSAINSVFTDDSNSKEERCLES